MAVSAEDRCGALVREDDCYCCTLPRGHEGEHMWRLLDDPELRFNLRARLNAARAERRTFELDQCMPLLAKLASGEGGRRTGALKRAGYLEWTVTPAGLEALAKRGDR